MRNSVITVSALSKVYNIGHESQAAPGTLTFRDSLMGLIAKPLEIVTGHRLKSEKFWALKNISFDIEKGDVVGIVGRNGSGKSTFLKVLSRIVEPTSGEVHMKGRVASLLEVGTGFHPELTGRENIYFNGAILGMSRKEIKAKFEEIVAFSEVEKFLDTPVKYYSSGMYVRLAFSVAAHLDPDILIVDEVLAVGDAAFQKKCLGKMQDIAGQGRTVLFVSHSMASIKALCTKAAWLANGELREFGDIESVTDHYLESTIASGDIDLSERPRSTPISGEAKIVAVDVKSKNTDSEIVDSSKDMLITFLIESKEEIKNVALHCVINANGQNIVRLLSEYTGNTFDLSIGLNKISCCVLPSNLTGGLYTIDCSILFPGRETSGHIDEIFDAKTFVVADLKVPHGELYLSQREAIVYVDHNWREVR